MDTVAASGAPPQSIGDLLSAASRLATGDPEALDEALHFLRSIDATGRHNLVAIDPTTGHVEGRTFERADDAAQWIAERNGRANLYWSVNEPVPGAPHDKLRKEHIGAIRALVADLDPPGVEALDRERAEIASKAAAVQATNYAPTITLDSGSGCQMIWKLAEKLEPTEHRQWAEDQGRAIRAVLNGDAVQNIDRIMRLPGTLNIPNAAKLAKGRVERLASVTYQSDRSYSPDALSNEVRPIPADNTDRSERVRKVIAALDFHAISSCGSFDALPAELRAKFLSAHTEIPDLATLWEGEPAALRNHADTTGSSYRASLAFYLGRRGGFTADDYGKLVWVWGHAVQPHHNREDRISARAIARDWVNVGEPQDFAARWFDANAAAAAAARADADGPRRFVFEGFEKLADAASREGVAPLIKGLLDQGAMSVLYGESNSGKTFVALDMAFHVATGGRWFGMRTADMPVLYIAAEGGRGFSKRIAALRVKYQPTGAVRLEALRSSVNLLREDADLEPLIEAIRAMPTRPGLIVLDTLSRAMAGGDENASTDMGGMVRHLDALRGATGAHLLVVHHSGKNLAKGARGHSLLRAATDTEIEIADKRVKVTKQRDIDGNFQCGFDLEPITFGVDADGDAITSCVVHLRAEEPKGNDLHSPAEALKRDAVAKAVLTALGGKTSAPAKPLHQLILKGLAAANVDTGASWPTIRDLLKSTIGTTPAEVLHRGQVVRVEARKEGQGDRAPLVISTFIVAGDASDNLSGKLESAEKSEVFS